MSEENVPKLRLKPKLAAAPVDAPLPPAVVPVPPPPVASEAKAVRLKPKLTALAPQSFASPTASEVVPGLIEPAAVPSDFPPPGGLSSDAEKPTAKFTLRPKEAIDPNATIPPAFPPPLPPREAGAEMPVPAPDYVDPERADEPPMVLRSVTSRPFPPPPANFPPPPAGSDKPAPPWAHPKAAVAAPKKKNLILMGGGVVVAIGLLGGAFLAYKKFTAEPATPVKSTVAVIKKDPDATASSGEEANPVATVAETSPAASVSAPAAHLPEVAPVEIPPPPPPPSAAFKAWVDALRIGGVRGGASARVFIGGTAYAPGEMVNPQLGIAFDSYNAETRRVIFKDKSGATVERRN